MVCRCTCRKTRAINALAHGCLDQLAAQECLACLAQGKPALETAGSGTCNEVTDLADLHLPLTLHSTVSTKASTFGVAPSVASKARFLLATTSVISSQTTISKAS